MNRSTPRISTASAVRVCQDESICKDIITEETGWLEYGRYLTLAERRRVRQERVSKILKENRKGALS